MIRDTPKIYTTVLGVNLGWIRFLFFCWCLVHWFSFGIHHRVVLLGMVQRRGPWGSWMESRAVLAFPHMPRTWNGAPAFNGSGSLPLPLAGRVPPAVHCVTRPVRVRALYSYGTKYMYSCGMVYGYFVQRGISSGGARDNKDLPMLPLNAQRGREKGRPGSQGPVHVPHSAAPSARIPACRGPKVLSLN